MLGQGASGNSRSRTSLITSDAGLKTSFEASCLTRDFMLVAIIALTGAAWLWSLFSTSNSFDDRCITVALQRLP